MDAINKLLGSIPFTWPRCHSHRELSNKDMVFALSATRLSKALPYTSVLVGINTSHYLAVEASSSTAIVPHISYQ